ncbi:MAG: glycosyltransferase family 4 protein [Dehalococcoidia bacterium]
MPHVLHLIDTGGPGGAETVFRDLILGLATRGWENTAVVPYEGWLSADLRAKGVEPIVLETQGAFDMGYMMALRRTIRMLTPDVVQTHLLTTGVYATLSDALASRPIVSTFHGLPDLPERDTFIGVKTRLFRGNRNTVVCVSAFLREQFIERGLFSDARTEVIHNGVALDGFGPGRHSPLRHELDIPGDVPVVGALGNVRPSKAYDVLLKAFAELRSRIPSAHLVIVGQAEGRLFDALVGLIQDLGLGDSVVFTGFREDVPQLLRGMDVLAISSSDEGFSLAAVQAMATGLPVVATRCGGPEEIVVDGVTGILVENGRPAALASALFELLPDRYRRRSLGEAGRMRAKEQFSLGAMVDRYIRLYRRELAGARGAP